MKIRFASVTAGAAVLATTGALMLTGAGVANAATPPPWQPPSATNFGDTTNQIGTATLYNASGAVITGGSVLDSPFAAFAAGSTPVTSQSKAVLNFATPVPSQNQGGWPTEQGSGSTTFPNPAAPAPVSGLGTHPVVTGAAGDESLATYIQDFPNTDSSTAGFTGVYEARVKTGSNYQSVDVQVSNLTSTGTPGTDSYLVTGGTWAQIYPAALTSTNTAVVSSENPSVQGDNVTFTATVTGSTTGTVAFTNGAATISGCGAVALTSGHASCSTTGLAVAPSSTITATFTPSDTATFAGSSGTVSQEVDSPKTPTTTTLAISGTYLTTGGPATLSGTVAPAAATGTVSFFDNGSSTSFASTPDTAGSFTFALTAGFTVGSHSVVAKFVPDAASAATYNGSQNAAPGFTTILAGGTCVQTGSSCSDTQTIQGEVPAGTLVISTPYTASNPLDVGNLALNGAGTMYGQTATFKCITITDSNGANTGFVAQAAASALSKTNGPAAPAGTYTSIDGQNVGLTNLVPSPAAANCPNGFAPVNSFTGAPGSIGKTDNPAAPGVIPGTAGSLGLGGSVAHNVLAGSANGVGTATYDGTLTLNAPTSTAPGTYTGTIVFTVSDGN